jgi:uncharacterized membrane protein YfcA
VVPPQADFTTEGIDTAGAEDMAFDVIVAAVAAVAGMVASVAGFGIGSLLTPVLALQVGTKLAVSLVSLPHMGGTLLRFWILRAHVDRRVLLNFGIASAVCGLVGAVLHAYLTSVVLSRIFGGLLVLAGISSLVGLMERLHLPRWAAWVAGGLSGIFGGLVGNQGSIRSAALLGFHVPRDAFVATATAIALLVDMGRVPVYVATQGSAILQHWPHVIIGLSGVIVGTLVGARVLRRIPENIFRRLVGLLVLAIGIYMLVRPT